MSTATSNFPLLTDQPFVVVPACGPAQFIRRRRAVPLRTSSAAPFSHAARCLDTGRPLVPPAGNRSFGYLAAKRALDIFGALTLLVALGPLMLAVLVVLAITTRGRPLFWQRRAGYCGRPFWIVKFATMKPGAARRQHEVRNEQSGPIFKNRRDPRITRLGRFLRKSSLDETPQLFNVLVGRMSLVGPRPLPIHEVAQLQAWHRRRLAVKPGLTCLWQVSGRSDIGFEEWMRLDLRYVRSQSWLADLRLLWRTPLTVLTGRGAY